MLAPILQFDPDREGVIQPRPAFAVDQPSAPA